MCIVCGSEKSFFKKTNKTNKKLKVVFGNCKNKMLTNCSNCRKHIYNVCPTKLIMMTIKKILKCQDVLIVCQINRFLIK